MVSNGWRIWFSSKRRRQILHQGKGPVDLSLKVDIGAHKLQAYSSSDTPATPIRYHQAPDQLEAQKEKDWIEAQSAVYTRIFQHQRRMRQELAHQL